MSSAIAPMSSGLGSVVDPDEYFSGIILVVAPHMDDEVLACGGTIAMLADPSRVHIIFATDGMKSPSPVVPWRDSITPDLGEIRVRESQAAARMLGLKRDQLHFLRLPEARLRDCEGELRARIEELLRDIAPDHILVPFRYDRHPDHLAVTRSVVEARRRLHSQTAVSEYFVYYRWRLLEGRDVRRYIRSGLLVEVDTTGVAERKRAALRCFRTQTTCFYPWQTRPILTSALLDEVSFSPEVFLRRDRAGDGAAVFVRARLWIRIVHRLEPFLQRWKYRIGATLKRASRHPRAAAADAVARKPTAK
jgi:LmbE family N-acetylglucosaminyl deacetylase